MILWLRAQGNERDSPSTRIKIAWDGEWLDGDVEMAKHLVVKELKEGESG